MKKWIPNQKILFFMQNALSFGLIFIALGFILTSVINTTAYNQIDASLIRNANAAPMLVRGLNGSVAIVSSREPDDSEDIPRIDFQSEVIFWTKDGKKATFFQDETRSYVFNQIKFSDLVKDNIQKLSFKDKYNQRIYFRSYLAEYKGNAIPNVAYIQVVTNTNQVTESTNHTQMVVEISIFAFYLLSLALSYYLARIQMRPLLVAWKKQQVFVADASHELRTPLAIIQNKLEMLFTKPETTIIESSEGISDSLSEIRRLRQLTSDLLTLTRGENENVIEREKADLHEFLEKIVDNYKEIAEISSKKISLEFTEGARSEVEIDKKRLRQLLVILIDNALKYSRENDVIVVEGKIGKDIEIAVKDTGIGIPDDKKALIFDRFVRVDDSRNKQTGGFGLGLSIAKQLVDGLNGKIQVSDNFPCGSVFKVNLPK